MKTMQNNITKLILMSLMTFSAVLGAAQVRVNDQVKVSSKVVTIGDIAWVNAADENMVQRLNNMIVAEKDEMANNLTVTAFDISHCLSRAGINPAAVDIYGSLNCRVTFTGPGSTVALRPDVKPIVEVPVADPAKSIKAELDRQVSNTTGYDLDRLSIDWKCSEDGLLELAMDNGRYTIEPQRAVSLGNVRYMVTDKTPQLPDNVLPQHEKFYTQPKTFYVNGYVQYVSEYVVATHDMSTGEVLRESDLKLIPQLVSSVSQVGVSSLDAVVGQQLVRSVQAEQIIKTNMVKKLTLVDRNTPVYVRYDSSAIAISTKGIAMGDGGMNDVIPVKITHKMEDGKRPVSQVLYCKIVAPGEAVVVKENQLGNNSEEFASSNW